MSYEIEYSQNAVKDLKNLDQNTQENIINALERIRIRPYSFVKKIVSTPFYRLKVDKYRVIMDIKDNILRVFVIKIGHRKNIYKKFD